MLYRSCFGKTLLVSFTSSITSFSDSFLTLHFFAPCHFLPYLKQLLPRSVAMLLSRSGCSRIFRV